MRITKLLAATLIASAACIGALEPVSTVAASRRRQGGFPRTARAMASRIVAERTAAGTSWVGERPEREGRTGWTGAMGRDGRDGRHGRDGGHGYDGGRDGDYGWGRDGRDHGGRWGHDGSRRSQGSAEDQIQGSLPQHRQRLLTTARSAGSRSRSSTSRPARRGALEALRRPVRHSAAGQRQSKGYRTPPPLFRLRYR